MKKFINEFKEFALKGNMIDLAVGMIIGAAFTALINSLVANIFNPVIGLITGGVDLENALKVKIGETMVDGVVTPLTINFGAFISAIINFIIMAFVIFLFVKGVNKARAHAELVKNGGKKPEEAAPPKICPFCKSEIPHDATRCPHCTSVLE
ncbi:MAG: large conductance mechanosensitive channel protein MscL [Lachnospiraceae bacterium]|nr:large conductance mechanosensitive channel protein MscL [Lachnospiraceae bacterium]